MRRVSRMQDANPRLAIVVVPVLLLVAAILCASWPVSAAASVPKVLVVEEYGTTT